MQKRIHGGDTYGYADLLDFSMNINPLGLPDTVKAALTESIPLWARYPDPHCRDLTDALIRTEDVPAEWVHFGNGAADLIFRIVQALRPQRALTLAPTFSEYACALEAMGCDVSFHTLYEREDFRLTESVLKKLSPELDLLVICNPNNPTGQPVEPELMKRILHRCTEYQIVLLVDECFIPFLDFPEAYTLKQELADHPNVILLRAFTKLYAMAGLRLGYLLCSDRKLIEAVCNCEPSWNVSIPAQIAGIAALSDTAYLEASRVLVKQERVWLTDALRRCGVQVMGSQANYLFFRCNECRNLKERLLRHGILIRSCEDYPGLDDRFYRAAVRCRPENEQLAAALAAELMQRRE